MNRLSGWIAGAAMSASLACFACQSQQTAPPSAPAAPLPGAVASDYDHAVAVIHAVGGSGVSGVVIFTQEAGGVRVVADLEGLAPGKHGFHIHEFGDCRDMTKASSTGGHFNPAHESHGMPTEAHHHAGDMGNIEANAWGQVHMEEVLPGLTIGGENAPIIGRSVIVHEKPDDGTASNNGNAGGRVGCGVIGVENVKYK